MFFSFDFAKAIDRRIENTSAKVKFKILLF
jgi:hypothetical protein